jgi:CheY-like chemotaxis protein
MRTNENNAFALATRPSEVLAKAAPGAKRILSDMVADALALAKKEPSRNSRPLRIVLVDDEDWFTGMVERAIHHSFKNVIVHTFHNRDEAWQELLRADPDLVITDMNNDNLPFLHRPYLGMSGWEMLPLLAERKVKYPILVVSGSFLMEGVESKARECAGPDLNVSFLTKPFTLKQFNLELLKHLGPGDNPQRQILNEAP